MGHALSTPPATAIPAGPAESLAGMGWTGGAGWMDCVVRRIGRPFFSCGRRNYLVSARLKYHHHSSPVSTCNEEIGAMYSVKTSVTLAVVAVLLLVVPGEAGARAQQKKK